MCALNFLKINLVVVFLLGGPSIVMALSTTASLQLEQKNTLQLNELSVPQSTKTFGLDLTQIGFGFSGQAQINQIKQDLSNRNLTLKNSVVIPLTNIDSGERTTAVFGVNYSQGNHSASLTIDQDIKPSLFTSRNISLGYNLQIYEGATQFRFNISTGENNQPLSYFIDPQSLESKERATVVRTNTYAFSIQQIWTKRLKTQFGVQHKTAGLFRPDDNQLKISSAYVLNADWTLRNAIGFAQENRNQPLTFDRGYFQSQWIDTELIYEWTLDSFLILGTSFLDEIETDPRRDLKTILGTDEIAFGIKNSMDLFNYNLNVSHTLNSEQQTSTSFGAGIEWTF